MIELRGVTKRYGRVPVVDGLSLRLPKGRVFGFLGQNGAGKTTTIKMLVGLCAPSEGEILLDGAPVSESETRRKVGFMPEAPYFYERLTGLEFLGFCGELFGQSPRLNRAEHIRLLAKVGLAEAKDRAIRDYSKGMKQRLGFAQALVNDPEYVFLDEPLDGLDPIGRREIKDIIRELRAEGRTVFFNSHILFDTEELCDEIGIIHRGRLLYSGPVAGFGQGRTLEERFVGLVESAGRVI